MEGEKRSEKDKWAVSMTNERTGDSLQLFTLDAKGGDLVSYTVLVGGFGEAVEYGGYVRIQD